MTDEEQQQGQGGDSEPSPQTERPPASESPFQTPALEEIGKTAPKPESRDE